jgi:hypothetical protein
MGEYMAAQMDRQIEGAQSENAQLADENVRLRKILDVAMRFSPRVLKCPKCDGYHANGYVCACGYDGD